MGNLLTLAEAAQDLDRHIATLHRWHLQGLDAGGERIRLQALLPADRRHLKEILLTVRQMQDELSQRFQLDLLG